MWSEEDSCIASLSVDLDNMVSPQLSLHSVLERVATCLEKAQRREKGRSNGGGGERGKEEGEEEEESDMDDGDNDEEEEEDDDDGYYGDDIDDDGYYGDIDADTAVDDEPSHSRYRCLPVTNNFIALNIQYTQAVYYTIVYSYIL